MPPKVRSLLRGSGPSHWLRGGPRLKVNLGDVLEFHFMPKNHSVVMGDFDSPCMPAASGGFSSGFLPTNSSENVSSRFHSAPPPPNKIAEESWLCQPQVFRVTINDTRPMVFYCSLCDTPLPPADCPGLRTGSLTSCSSL